MTEFILQNDPIEFQNTRQSTKITFLQDEIKQLQDYIKDLQKFTKINKDALILCCFQTKSSSSNPNTINNTNNNTTTTKSKHGNDTTDTIQDPLSIPENQNTLQLILEHLNEENLKLISTVERLTKERNMAQNKALISEQICEEAQRHEIEAVAELDEKVNELRNVLQNKEYIIQELENINPPKEGEVAVTKYREIIPPNDYTLKIHNEIENAHLNLAKAAKEFNKFQIEKQELMKTNMNLLAELNRIRSSAVSTLQTTIPSKQLKDIFPNPTPIIDFNASQFGLGNLPESDNDLSPAPSPLPEKVSKHPLNHMNQKANVPKLDLTKAKKIQEINAVKSSMQPIQQQQQKQQGLADAKIYEKIKALENEIENTKKMFKREVINNKLLADELINLQRQNTQTSAINETLIKSNKRYEEKWQKIFYSLEFYRDFYHKYIDLISNKPQPVTRSVIPYPIITQLDNVKKLKEKFNINLEGSPDVLINGLKKIEEENGKEINVSILNAEDDMEYGTKNNNGNHENNNENEDLNHNNNENNDNIYALNLEQCRQYLLSLARDLYVNSNISKSTIGKHVLKHLNAANRSERPQNMLKLKRSVSNPLDYVNARKQEIFDTNFNKKKAPKKPKKILKGGISNGLDPQIDANMNTGIIGDTTDNDNVNGNINNLNQVGMINGEEVNLSFMDAMKKSRRNLKNIKTGLMPDDISFNVEFEENKKLAEVSFISNNDIF